MKSTLLLATLALATGIAFAQAEPGAPAIDDPIEAQFVDETDATTMLQEFLDKKGWTDGRNEKGNSHFVVVTGTGIIAAPPTDKNYNSSRMNAANKAFLDAKANLASYLEQEIAVSAQFLVIEPPQDMEPAVEEELAAKRRQLEALYNQDNSVCKKAITLIHKKLDKALSEEGYDLESQKAKTVAEYQALQEKVNAITEKSGFKQSVKASAATLVSGLQIVYSVECRGEIGVVAVWSPLLAEMASSMTTGASVANKAPKRPIKEQIPSDANTLINTFGVQQKINENGELVLVAFAQEAAVSKSKQAQKNAYKKAELQADGALRGFAGEAVATNSELEKAEESTDFGDYATPDYRDQSAYANYQRSAGLALKLNGVRTLHRWKAIHPVSGATVYGVVRAWSPREAALTRDIKAEIETSASKGATGKRTITPPAQPSSSPQAKPSIQQDDYIYGGAIGDEDAF